MMVAPPMDPVGVWRRYGRVRVGSVSSESHAEEASESREGLAFGRSQGVCLDGEGGARREREGVEGGEDEAEAWRDEDE